MLLHLFNAITTLNVPILSSTAAEAERGHLWIHEVTITAVIGLCVKVICLKSTLLNLFCIWWWSVPWHIWMWHFWTGGQMSSLWRGRVCLWDDVQCDQRPGYDDGLQRSRHDPSRSYKHQNSRGRQSIWKRRSNSHTFQLKVKASNNYLALRNQTGHYYLNGNWRIDYPQQFEAAGKLKSILDPRLKNPFFIGSMSRNPLHIGSMSRSQEQPSTTKESTRTRRLEVLSRFLPRRV